MKYSVVIPTYNHCDDLLKPCINGILNNTTMDDNIEIIVVANGCIDNTEEYLESLGGFNLKTVWFDEAVGYTKATNEGIKAADPSTEYIILLNNDAFLLDQPKNQWLDMLETPMFDKKTAVTQPMRAYSHDTQYHFIIFFCAMIRHSVIQDIGLLDEVFSPGGGEDIDFCIRAENAGYKIAETSITEFNKNKQLGVGSFPIYHEGEKTVHDTNLVPEWDYIFKRNMEILKVMYPIQAVELPEGQFSDQDIIPHQELVNKNMDIQNLQLIKLNLGCGNEILDGYINCDIINPKADMLFDATKVPFPDNSVDEIRAYHIIEHFPFKQGLAALTEWFRVLKPNGKLIIETPDLLNTCKQFVESDEATRIMLYGNFFAFPDISPLEAHYFLFTETQMFWSLSQIGFDRITRVEPDSTYAKANPNWQSLYLKTEAYKPDVTHKPKIYDGFLFFNELDMLEIRLNELNDVVDTFVLVESDTTFTGIPKPFYYEENKERFKQFADKITHIKITGTPQTDSPWDAEKYQRDKIYDGMQQCAPDDIIIISDVDEIPNKEAIRNFDPTKGVTILQQKTSYYYLNCVSNLLWWNTKIGTWKDMQKETAYDVRANNNNRFVVGEGGWHFTGLGGIESILTKLDAFSHKEYNTEYFRDKTLLETRIKNGWDIYERPTIVATYWDVDNNFPEYIIKNQQLLAEKGLIHTIKQPQLPIDPAIHKRFEELNHSLYDEIFVQGGYMATEEDIKGKVYVDIGANVGMTALKAISLGAKKVLAFEPELSNLNTLLDVTKNLENVFVYHKAVYNSEDYIQVTNEGMLSNMFQVKESDERVPALSLGEVTRLIQSNEHAVMKIDCEGGEYDILYNTEPENIQRFDMLYLEIHNDLVPQYINGEGDLINYLTRLGFECEKLPFASGIWYPDGSFEETNNAFYKCKNKQIKIN